MRVWWREQPLDEHEGELVKAVLRAHAQSTFRENPSTMAVVMAAEGSGQYMHAIGAALNMFGGRHGPLTQTYDLLIEPSWALGILADPPHRLPGWGNSFHKDGIEPNWLPVAKALERWPAVWDNVLQIQKVVDDNNLGLYPNPSALTCAAALVLRCPRESVGWFVLAGRLDAWSGIFQKHQRQL